MTTTHVKFFLALSVIHKNYDNKLNIDKRENANLGKVGIIAWLCTENIHKTT